eukprot:1156978-Pelagomonas_calceolata.AAC.9
MGLVHPSSLTQTCPARCRGPTTCRGKKKESEDMEEQTPDLASVNGPNGSVNGFANVQINGFTSRDGNVK